ncbi:MAG: bifunctional phosphopantothenoylcysteine decarboxylase/phosphopantothenate--cysteine ligase CoaBC [Pyrinomonadaceae bacterium]
MSRYKIGLGVTGGIAAYKAVELMRLLQKAGCSVSVAMTKHSTEFVTPLTFRALADGPVIVDDYDPSNPDPIAHINFSQSIDLLLIAPATANIIAKMAGGIADDFLSATYLAATAPVIVAPAMNTEMWNHPATQRNIAKLRADGVRFIEPVAGELACKTVGTGKLEDVENIARLTLGFLEAKGKLQNDLAGEKLLITVGGTREPIDPVRFISNRSSGKMGFALALAASQRGAKVTAITGTVTAQPPSGIEVINVVTAEEMYAAVMKRFPECSIFIAAAAVADFRPSEMVSNKMKKADRETLQLELVRNPDILSIAAQNRRQGQLIIGFAAETQNVKEYAKEKLEKKGLDMVIANDITQPGAGFDTETNIASIIFPDGRASIDLPLMSKPDLANRILDEIAKLRSIGRKHEN